MKNQDGPLDTLIRALAGLPGLGPRSARRIALYLLTRRQKTMMPLISALQQAADNIHVCTSCGNLDSTIPCRICSDAARKNGVLCVVAGVGDLWAVERTGAFRGQYHVLGGILSALDGIGPDHLNIPGLIDKVAAPDVQEVILALSATVDGQATSHYIADRLHTRRRDLKITRLAHGMPVGGELGYLDDGTIATALRARAAAG